MTLSTAEKWSLLLAMLFAIALALLLVGCDSNPVSVPNRELGKSAQAQAVAIETGVRDAGKAVASAATQISSDVAEGKAKTPEPAQPVLNPIWDRIAVRARAMWDTSGTIADLAVQVHDLGGKVGQLNQAVTNLSGENAGLRTKLEKANSATERLTALVVALTFAAAGACVFFAVMLKDFKIGVAGVAGAAVVLVLVSFFGHLGAAVGLLFKVAMWIAVGCGVLFAGEVVWRKFREKLSWAGAVRRAATTNPLQDLQDVTGKP